MHDPRRRYLLSALSVAALGLLGLGSLGHWALRSLEPIPRYQAPGPPSAQSEADAHLIDPDSWRITLWGPLVEEAVIAPAPEPAAPAPFQGRLVAILSSGGTSKAMISLPDGGTRSLTVGQEKDGIRLLAIDNDTVDIEHGGRTHHLELP